MPFITWLVVMLGIVFLRDRLPTCGSTVHEVKSFGEAHGRYPHLREREMVRAIKAAGFGVWIRGEVASLSFTFSDDVIGKIEPRRSADGEVSLQTVGDPGVDVEVGDGLREWIKRVRCVIAGA